MNYDYGYPRQRIQTSRNRPTAKRPGFAPKYVSNDKRSFANINALSKTAARLKILKPSSNPNKYRSAKVAQKPVVDQNWSKAPPVGFVSPEELQIKTDNEYTALNPDIPEDGWKFLGLEWYFWAGGGLTLFIIIFLLIILIYRHIVASKFSKAKNSNQKLGKVEAPVRLADLVNKTDNNCVSERGKIPISQADHFASMMPHITQPHLSQFNGAKSIYSESSYGSKFNRNDDSGYSAGGGMTLSARPTPHGSQYAPAAMNAQFISPPAQIRQQTHSLHIGQNTVGQWPTRDIRTLRRAQSMAIHNNEVYEDVIPNITPSHRNTSHRYNTLPVKKPY